MNKEVDKRVGARHDKDCICTDCLERAAVEEFHQLGRDILDVVRDYDRRLCAAMGKGIYSTYSQKLSEKFWSLVRQDFSQIDMVGVKVKQR